MSGRRLPGDVPAAAAAWHGMSQQA